MNHSIQLVLPILALWVSGLQATPMPINGHTNSIAIVDAPFAGTLLGSHKQTLGSNGNSGTFATAVYGTGAGLDFYYQLTNGSGSVEPALGFMGRDFLSVQNTTLEVFQTGAAFGHFAAGTLAPLTVSRSDTLSRERADMSPVQTSIAFVWTDGGGIASGAASFTQIIRTTASTWGYGHFAVGDSYEGGWEPSHGFGLSGETTGISPTGIASAVPEPEAPVLLLAGLALIGALAHIRRVSPRRR